MFVFFDKRNIYTEYVSGDGCRARARTCRFNASSYLILLVYFFRRYLIYSVRYCFSFPRGYFRIEVSLHSDEFPWCYSFSNLLFTESETVYRPGSNCKRASFWLHIYQHSLLISWSLWTARASKSTPSRTSEETLCIKGPVPIVALFFALLLLLISQEARSSIVCFLVWARRAWPLNKWTSPAQKSSFSCFLRVPSIFCYVWKTWRVLIILSILWVSL